MGAFRIKDGDVVIVGFGDGPTLSMQKVGNTVYLDMNVSLADAWSEAQPEASLQVNADDLQSALNYLMGGSDDHR